MALMGEVLFRLGLETNSYTRGLSRAQRATKTFDDTVRKLGQTLTTVFSAVAIEEFVRRSIKSFVEFDHAMANVATMSAANMGYMRREVQKLALQYGKDVTNAADALYYIVSAGYDASDAITVLDYTMKGAVAGAADLKTTADALTSILEVYKMRVDESSKALDVMFAALKYGKMTFQDMASAVGIFLPSAKALGVSLEEAMGTFAYLTKTLKPDEAKTSLNAIYRSLMQNRDVLNKLGIQLYDSQGRFIGLANVAAQVAQIIEHMSDAERAAFWNMMQLDIRAQRGFLQLAQNLENYRKVLQGVERSTGESTKAFEAQARSLSMLYERFNTARDILFKNFGQVFMKLLAPAIEGATKRMERFSQILFDLGQNAKTPLDIFRAIFDYMKAWYRTLNPIMQGLITFAGAFLALQIGAKAFNLLAGAVISGGKVILTVFKTIFSWPFLLISALYLLRVAWRHDWFGMRTTVLEAWDAMKAAWSGAWKNLEDIWKNPDLSFLDKVAASVGLIAGKIFHGGEGYEGLGSIWSKAYDKLKETWSNPDLSMLEKVKDTVVTLSDAMYKSLVSIGAALTDAFGGDAQQYVKTVDEHMENLWNTIQNIIKEKDLKEKLKSSFDALKEAYKIPAVLTISGFVPEENFKETWVDNLANAIGAAGLIKLLGGKLRFATGFALIADAVLGDNVSKDEFVNKLTKSIEGLIGIKLAFGANGLMFKVGIVLTGLSIAGFGIREYLQKHIYDPFKSLAPYMEAEGWFGKLWERAFKGKVGWLQTTAETLAQLVFEKPSNQVEAFFKDIQILALSTALIIGQTFADMWDWITSDGWEKFKKLFGNIKNNLEGIANTRANPEIPATGRAKYYIPGHQLGGYTALVGTSEIAGVVHGGEWVAPAWMVKHPVWGKLIASLEKVRVRGFQLGGYTQGAVKLTGAVANPEIDFIGDIKETISHDVHWILSTVNSTLEEALGKLGFEGLDQQLKDVNKGFETLTKEQQEQEKKLKELNELIQNQADIWKEQLAQHTELLTLDKGELKASQKLQIAMDMITKIMNRDFKGALLDFVNIAAEPFFEFLSQFKYIVELMNPFTTLITAFLEGMTPLFKDFDSIARGIIDVVGGVLRIFGSLFNILRPFTFGISALMSVLGWAMDQLVLWVNSLPIIGGFLTEEDKKRMSQSIEQRMEGYGVGGLGGETSTTGQKFSVGSVSQINNTYNFYFEGNYLLTEDDAGAKRLAEVILKVLEDRGVRVVTS